jgi:bifunctional non-homologous end joining protein LigD
VGKIPEKPSLINRLGRWWISVNDNDVDQLSEYRRKRDFDRTAEPAADAEAPYAGASAQETGDPKRLAFVVQKHAASSLHYDFRLELDGVLKSWAVPKGPSLDPADKRLAVMTEDHPLEYASFEGVIPEGEYGGGTVLVWDAGWWEPDLAWIDTAKEPHLAEPVAALTKGELKFVLHGSKLTGSWALVQMKGRGDKNWLLIKHRDEAARPGTSLVAEAPDSVLTARSLEQVQRDSGQGA